MLVLDQAPGDFVRSFVRVEGAGDFPIIEPSKIGEERGFIWKGLAVLIFAVVLRVEIAFLESNVSAAFLAGGEKLRTIAEGLQDLLLDVWDIGVLCFGLQGFSDELLIAVIDRSF